MALTAYLAATNRLLQNPVPSTPLYSESDLTDYINEARLQLAGDAQCIRATATGALTIGQQIYPFSTFSTFPSDAAATGYIDFTVNPSPGDTATFNGVVYTFISGSTSGTNIHIDVTVGLTIAQNLLVAIQASVNPLLTVASYTADSDGGGGVLLNVTYNTGGTAGNSYTLAASAATPSGATLSGGGASLPGISSVLTIRQLMVNTSSTIYKMLISRSWPWFNRYYLANASAIGSGTPTTWSQQGLGTKGTFGVDKLPTSALALKADVVCLPVSLVNDVTAEAIPYPFTDAVPYYAAYKAYLSSQKTNDATVMLGRYKEFVKRAVEETTPSVLPENYIGGLGTQIASGRQSLTQQSGGGGSGGSAPGGQ